MIKFLSLLCSLAYVWALVLSMKRTRGFAIGPIFLLVFGGVIMTRPMIAAISDDFDVAAGSWMYWGVVPDDVLVRSLILILIFLLAFVFVLSFFRPRNVVERTNNRVLEQVSVFFLVASAPLYAYRGYLLMSAIADAGYFATFTGEVQTPFIVNIGYAIFQVSYLTFLAAVPDRASFKRVTIFFLILSASSLGSGQRTEFVSAVLFTYWAGLHLGLYEFKLRRVSLMAVPLLFVSIVINAWRLGVGINESFAESVLSFFWGQGVTIFTIFGLVENRTLFSPFEGFFFPNKFLVCDLGPYLTGQFCANNVATVKLSGLWWQRLSYILDPEKFLEGGGLGGNVVSSLYLMFNFENFALSATMLGISASVFFWLLIRSGKLQRGGVFANIYFIYLMQVMTFLPRAALDALIPHIRYMIALAFIVVIYQIAKIFRRRSPAP